MARKAEVGIPLDEVPLDRTLEFVGGSHLWGKSYRPQRFNGQALNENDGLEESPDINGHRGDYDILAWPLSPGDAVAFDYRTVHGAPANNSPSAQRRAFSLRLVGDGFLRGMVRSIVGTLLEVGGGKRPVEEMARLLTGRSRSEAGPTAPARGLVLHEVFYPPAWRLPGEGAAPRK